MMNLKSLLVGGVFGIVSTLAGVSLAHAECSQGSREAALAASEACPVDGGFYETANGTWVSYCNTAFQLDVCEELSNQVSCDNYADAEACDVAMGDVYEGCLALAGMTGMVKP